MIKEYILKKILDKALDEGKKVLTESKSNLIRSREDVESSINTHLNGINNWASTISFSDLKQSKYITDVYIQLDLYVYPRRHWIQDESKKVESIPLEQIFERNKNHFIILGHPGAGKTTSMKYLCQKLFLDENFYPKKFSLPLLIKLRDVNKVKIPNDSTLIIDTLYNILGLNIEFPEHLRKDENSEERKWIKEKLVINFLEKLKALIIIDGFDEVINKGRRLDILTDIRNLFTYLKESSVVVTSRTGDFNYSIENASEFEISPLNDEQIKKFAFKWLNNKRESKKFYEKVKNSPFADTAIRPLTLAHLCAIYERIGDIPNKPKTVYKKIINLLLEEWDQQRTVARQSNYANFETDRKFDFLCHLAFILTTKFKKTIFYSLDLLSAYGTIFENFDLKKGEAKQVVNEIESHTGLLLQSGYEQYEFAHKSLQEFLTAEYLVRLPNILKDKKLLLLLPNELAIATTISSSPSEYFSQLVIERLINIPLPNEFIKPFLSRLLLEKPDFNSSGSLGLALVILYSKHIAENVIGSPQMKLFSYDEIFIEYEKLVALMLQRTSVNFINQNYTIDNSHKYEVDNHPIIIMKLKKAKSGKFLSFRGAFKLPKEIFVRESLLEKINYPEKRLVI